MLTCFFVIAIIGTLSSWVYLFLAWRAAVFFKRSDLCDNLPRSLEPVSVLKPVYGEDHGLEESLLTFFEQDHSNYELLFGARTFDDPALNIVRRLSALYSHVPTRIVASGEPAWPNARAFSVSTLISEAKNSTVVIADSDVRVGKDFISRVVAPISQPEVGLVTCLYRGVSLGGFWSGLEALGMSVELMSNVLIANMLSGMDFALGPATVTTREHIEEIGGLQESGLYYADDFALGNMIEQSGLKVILSRSIIEHVVPRGSFLTSIRHQLLWMKNNRYLRPKGHIGVGLTFAMPYALLGFISSLFLHNDLLAIAWLLTGAVNCVGRSILIGWGVVGDSTALRKSWLYPLRDLVGFGVWSAAWFGNKIRFRGQLYALLQSGKVERV